MFSPFFPGCGCFTADCLTRSVSRGRKSGRGEKRTGSALCLRSGIRCRLHGQSYVLLVWWKMRYHACRQAVCVCACSGTGHTRVISEARECRKHPRCISISCLKWPSSPGVTLSVAPADYLTRRLNLHLKMKQLLCLITNCFLK